MNIQIKTTLTKTRNPKEYGFKLENRKGEIIHTLDDGYSLVKFNELNINKKGTGKIEALEWYVHESDFHLQMIENKY